MKVKAQSCLTFRHSMDYTVHGILPARILDPFPSPGYLPSPGIEARSPALQADSLPAEPQGKPRVRCRDKQLCIRMLDQGRKNITKLYHHVKGICAVALVIFKSLNVNINRSISQIPGIQGGGLNHIQLLIFNKICKNYIFQVLVSRIPA